MHPVRRRRREERGLALRVRLREDALDVRREAAVEHLVRLVEHDVGDAVDAHRAVVQVVEHAAGRADDDLRAAVDGVLLRAEGTAAVDERRLDLRLLRQLVEHVADLDGQLARRHEDQRLEPLVLGHDLLDERQAERERLAGAGVGLADDVAAFEQGWYGVGLDVGRCDDVHRRRAPSGSPDGALNSLNEDKYGYLLVETLPTPSHI